MIRVDFFKWLNSIYMETKQILIYDTTLRDGTQGEQINLSAEDKLRIALKLDDFGFHYIEGGWPAANPKDKRFFKMASRENFINAKLVAFGRTRQAGVKACDDPNICGILESGVKAAAIFGKSWDMHISDVLGVSPDEYLDIIADTISFLKDKNFEVIFDAEHFFDGYIHNPSYAIKTVEAAVQAGADKVILCDTKGGTLPHEIFRIVSEAIPVIKAATGIHTHNDCGLALANTISAVQAGAAIVQGTVNGYGERCGNLDLISALGVFQLKMGIKCVQPEQLKKLLELSRFVSGIANAPSYSNQPFVGKSAFCHKGGVHVDAIRKGPHSYEHIDPGAVGNSRRILISDYAGKSAVEYKSRELGISLNKNAETSRHLIKEIKRLEDEGYHFDSAEGSLSVLIKKMTGQLDIPFELDSFRVYTEKDKAGSSSCHAIIKIIVGKDTEITAAEGEGPVNALDNALRKAIVKFYPDIQDMKLIDFKVRVIEGAAGTAAKVRVIIESRDDQEMWSTIGVSENILEAGWQALIDSIYYKLGKTLNGKNKK